jgi:hypothetical protein
VRRALSSIVKYNCRKDFTEHQQFPRKYVRDDEAGMLNCTWPQGGRPETPLLYSDEVWTGIEYEVAGALLFEGMVDEALALVAAVRERHDGRLRSPWNEVECGDHYVRTMSSWMLLEAAAGYVHDASRNLIGFGPRISPEDFRCFFATASGWGRYSQQVRGDKMSAALSVYWGKVLVRELWLTSEDKRSSRISAKLGATNIAFSGRIKGGRVIIRFREALVIEKDQSLRVSIG